MIVFYYTYYITCKLILTYDINNFFKINFQVLFKLDFEKASIEEILTDLFIEKITL